MEAEIDYAPRVETRSDPHPGSGAHDRVARACSAALSVERQRSRGDIDRFAEAWDALAEGVPFRSWAWLGAWWDALADDHELFVLTVQDDAGALVGVVPLMRDTSIAGGRRLQLLGAGKAATDYLTIASRPEWADAVVAAVVAWLGDRAADAEDGWDVLELDNHPIGDDRWRALIDGLVEAGATTHVRGALQCWHIPDLTDWEAYLARLSKSHRKQVRRTLKRDLADPRFEVRRAASDADFERGWRALVDLHQRRFDARDMEGCFTDAAFERFLRGAAEASMARGLLDLWWLEDEGRPVAAQIDFIGEAGCFSYQAGIDPDVTDYGPGQLLQIAVLREAAERGVGRYDFLRGDEGYKAHWRAEPTLCETTRVTPPHVSAQLRSHAWGAVYGLKELVKSALGIQRGESEPA